MNVAITKGIKITVTALFRSDLTQLEKNLFFFNYSIKIENLSHNRVQLISRYWRIVDSLAPTRIIEGKGVIGEQPTLEPGESHIYTSGCDLSSGLGFMEGYYNFDTINDQGEITNNFKVNVPRFTLEYAGKLN
ncbi:Co2+/Mg2+ efflux protein ApaG [Brumimicrobium glaciale]|jgi:ApaG protein|uniref:Co2+/Mg2+ efflux protein ApaG n=1 Tax=Brumimicrobium glaciale TaxID=200475 RepID=A0A4Q4KJP7_9FLAO|nr:Co2+/Mg2+ efflux protein ApaG [Brumimicrobium glaciale]RYM32917.1 Co2+/Mg2+ efflux protein ApaG [Brumimicrobium glaciale]